MVPIAQKIEANAQIEMQAEQTLGLPPQPPKKNLPSNRGRPPITPNNNILFDANRQKREEISQFLE